MLFYIFYGLILKKKRIIKIKKVLINKYEKKRKMIKMNYI